MVKDQAQANPLLLLSSFQDLRKPHYYLFRCTPSHLPKKKNQTPFLFQASAFT